MNGPNSADLARTIADNAAAATLATVTAGRLEAVLAELENFEWQHPCSDQYDKGYARGYENAMHTAAALLRAQTRCFYCRRNQHASCTSGETPCPCCDGGRES